MLPLPVSSPGPRLGTSGGRISAPPLRSAGRGERSSAVDGKMVPETSPEPRRLATGLTTGNVSVPVEVLRLLGPTFRTVALVGFDNFPLAIDRAERAALYQSLGVNVRYRRPEGREEVRLTSTLGDMQLEPVGGGLAR